MQSQNIFHTDSHNDGSFSYCSFDVLNFLSYSRERFAGNEGGEKIQRNINAKNHRINTAPADHSRLPNTVTTQKDKRTHKIQLEGS